MDDQSDTVGLEIMFHLRTVQRADVDVRHSKASAPFLVQIGKLSVFNIENAIKECEVIRDLLIAFDMEACARLGNSRLKVGHTSKEVNVVLELLKLKRNLGMMLKDDSL